MMQLHGFDWLCGHGIRTIAPSPRNSNHYIIFCWFLQSEISKFYQYSLTVFDKTVFDHNVRFWLKLNKIASTCLC